MRTAALDSAALERVLVRAVEVVGHSVRCTGNDPPAMEIGYWQLLIASWRAVLWGDSGSMTRARTDEEEGERSLMFFTTGLYVRSEERL